jgi:hypothetical protein
MNFEGEKTVSGSFLFSRICRLKYVLLPLDLNDGPFKLFFYCGRLVLLVFFCNYCIARPA